MAGTLRAAASLLLLACGCNVYDPSLVDGGAGGDSSVPETCAAGSRIPPPRPTGEDTDGPEVIFAMKEVRLNQDGDAWRDIGFNLDGICTQPPDLVTECHPPRPTAMPLADGNEGIDNAFGAQLYPLVALVYPELQEVATTSSEEGLGDVMLRIRGWNGLDNDPRVEVMVSQSVTATPGPPGATEPPDVNIVDFQAVDPVSGDRAPLPAWDGNDWFWLRSDTFSMADPDRPRVFDDNAYVADRTLVVTLPSRAEIIFSGGTNGVLVRLTDAHFVGTIDADATHIGPVTGAGRFSVIDLLDTARSLGVCDGSSELTLLQSQLDTIADIRATPGTGGPGAACDALSVGVTFMGYRGHIAGITDGAELPNGCM